MSSYDLSSYSAALKVFYDDQKMQDMVYRNNPFWALVPKSQQMGGSQYPVPVITQSAVANATFAYAQSDQYAAQPFTFQVTRKKIYSVATVDNETLEAGATDMGAFMEPAKYAVGRAIRAMVNSIAMGLYRSGTGAQGSLTGAPSTGVCTLVNPSDIVFFEVGQTLQASATDGGSARAALGYVIQVNKSAGTFVVSDTAIGGAAGSPSGWTTGDFMTQRGNLNLQFAGLSGWLPATAPTSTDSWFGVNRYNDVWRLGGGRYDGSQYNIQEALVNGSELLDREGGMPTHAFMQHQWYGALVNALGAKVQYVDLTSTDAPGIGFKAIELYLANSSVKILADRSCQAATCYLLDLPTWKFRSIGEAPKVLTYGGPDWLRITNQDAAELRYGCYGQLACEAPAWSENITLGSL